MDDNAVYIGDGVYAQFDGYGVWLKVSDGISITQEIYLEPPVLRSLNLMWKRWTNPEEENKQ